MNLRLAGAWLTAGLCLAGVSAHAASFDCAKAAGATEKMICGDGPLADLDGRLADAYRRALENAADPEGLRNQQRAWLANDRRRCADTACLKDVYRQRLTALEAAAGQKEVVYSFTQAPFVNPKVVNDLSTYISDHGDQIVAINLTDAQGSNRYSCDVKVRQAAGDKPYVYFQTKDGGETTEFGYRYVGRTASGIDVLFTLESGGGSGQFESLLLVRTQAERGTWLQPSTGRAQSLVFKSRRTVLQKVGELGLGDRWDGSLRIDGDTILIGRDVGPMPEKSAARTIKIDLHP